MEDLVRRPVPGFWSGRRVLLTGHTGFKGGWLARMLAALGAQVTGFALDPLPGDSGFDLLGVKRDLTDLRGDLRDPQAVAQAVQGAEIVLHLAAQAIVSEGYRDPAGTWGSNVTGTLNLLDALRGQGVQAAVIVTSDKVYRNEASRAFVETDALGGDDPYSASKAACEILTASHRASFADLPPMATARAGNVIGGGDFGKDRLIPDLVRAERDARPLILRNPDSTRPFQHVLDVVAGLLLLAEALVAGDGPAAVNFGPAQAELSVRDLIGHWENATRRPVAWQQADVPVMAEKPRLALDSSLARKRLHWQPAHDTAQAVAATARWYGQWGQGHDMAAASDAAIRSYLRDI
ncbi:MAG: CDP-glucose 4,6-dehydratase [Paracoccus sp. (in: a-proteobacteria)]|uniref:CDP-glucose 4,6-dehydratase n=1 Tax=Paracoccus sp. TaxID=267 RepID=UPI0026DF58BE|nr:CDP-glucose 4,6-dehydratase [Paracoccus sp. (in: a-proteobacteria)]MDO5621280.1 CDP-glucose 4,6-dehydratase [Paracoccus sp. (in: a-proteobacteria)]